MLSWNCFGMVSERRRYRMMVKRMRMPTKPPMMMPVVIMPEKSLKVSWPWVVTPRLAP